MKMTNKLTKSLDKKIFGVAGGLATYLNIDPLIMRLLMVALFFAFDGVFLIYLVLAFIMPDPTPQQVTPATKEEAVNIIFEKDPGMVSY